MTFLHISSGSDRHLFRVKIKGESKNGLVLRLNFVRADEFCALTCRKPFSKMGNDASCKDIFILASDDIKRQRNSIELVILFSRDNDLTSTNVH